MTSWDVPCLFPSTYFPTFSFPLPKNLSSLHSSTPSPSFKPSSSSQTTLRLHPFHHFSLHYRKYYYLWHIFRIVSSIFLIMYAIFSIYILPFTSSFVSFSLFRWSCSLQDVSPHLLRHIYYLLSTPEPSGKYRPGIEIATLRGEI